LEFTNQAPFHDVVLHGLIRDKKGRKMSKSLGNGIDPVELVDEYGADALKFTLLFLCAQGQDILIDKETFKLGSKFANKVWNASRYILMNLEGAGLIENPALLPLDQWIYTRLSQAASAVCDAMQSYRFNDAASAVYEYFWNDLCDWYVEATKLSTKSGNIAEQNRALTVLLNVLAESLKLLHPFIPFVSEEIWQKLPNTSGLLITQNFPSAEALKDRCASPSLARSFATLQDMVRQIRTLRAECTLTQDKKLSAILAWEAEFNINFIEENTALIKLLAGLNEIQFNEKITKPAGAIGLTGAGWEVFVNIGGAEEAAKLKMKFEKEWENEKKYIGGLEGKLANPAFVRNAPSELVDGERAKLAEAQRRMDKLTIYISSI
jgi:valyl-tRNA synthetase